MVSNTNCIFRGPFMNLSRARLSLIVAANLYVMISSAVMFPKSHFLSMSTSLFQYSSKVWLSSCFILKKWALLWKTFLTGRNVFLNSVNNSGNLTSFISRPHCHLMISCLAFGPRAQITSPFMWYTV